MNPSRGITATHLKLVASPAQEAQSVREPRDPRLHRVAQEFESILLRSMLSSVRQADEILGGETDEPAGSSFIHGLVDEQLAVALARQGGLGLGRMLESEIARRDREVVAPDAKSNELPEPQISLQKEGESS